MPGLSVQEADKSSYGSSCWSCSPTRGTRRASHGTGRQVSSN